jgi:hypothetical protein
MCLMSMACQSQCPLSPKHPEFALSVAVVDTRGVLRARETTARGVYITHVLPMEVTSFIRDGFVSARLQVGLTLSVGSE